MAEVKWIKITTNMFEDEKIDFIESLPEADAILVVWIKLLTMAGKNNSNGFIFLTEQIPYTVEMLAHRFRRPLNTVKLALETLKSLEMISFDDDGFLNITNWEKHQNIEGLERIREQTRKRVARYRERQKQLEEGNEKSNDTVTEGNATDIDIDIDIDIDKDIDKEQLPSNYKKTIIEKWNSLGLQQLRNIANNRLSLLNARIKEYSFDEVIQAIDSVNSSSFLKGQNKQGWTITFDWMIKPNNFVKVLEGNYLDKEVNHGEHNRDNGGEVKGSEDEIDWAEMAGVKSF